jgi:hypothetical protein
MLCPDKSRTRLLAETVEDMAKWMSKDNITDPEIRYWIPKYILMRGSKPLAAMGFMSPQFKALAISQDIIGWREFTEGHILTHFYAIQSFHLAMSSSYLNGEDWTKQFISKILQITHSQWIFRNISFHNRKNGYLRNKTADELLQHINSLSEVSPDKLPESSRFLLEINFSELSKHHLETQRYWTLAVDAALKANALEQARGAQAKRVRRKLNTKIPSRRKLGIAAVEHQIRQDGMHQAGPSNNPHATDPLQSSLATFIRRRPHPASVIAGLRSSKRLRKPD